MTLQAKVFVAMRAVEKFPVFAFLPLFYVFGTAGKVFILKLVQPIYHISGLIQLLDDIGSRSAGFLAGIFPIWWAGGKLVPAGPVLRKYSELMLNLREIDILHICNLHLTVIKAYILGSFALKSSSR